MPFSSRSRSGVNFMFNSAPPVLSWSILAAERTTAVGPWRSAPWTGEMPSESGRPGLAAVGHGAGHRAEVDVAGRGQHLDAVAAALGIGPPVELLEAGGEGPHHQLVGLVVVVAVLGRLVQGPLPQVLAAGVVRVQGRDEIGQRERSASRRPASAGRQGCRSGCRCRRTARSCCCSGPRRHCSPCPWRCSRRSARRGTGPASARRTSAR